jgi:nucleoside-diphosphate-sugar epimerase
MKVLVTGAPGWLGTRLVRRLVSNGERVRCLVYPNDWSFDAAKQVLPGAQIITGDIRNSEIVDQAMQGIHTVFHLAGARHSWRTGVLRSINVDGTKNIGRAARIHGVNHVIHTSSISVFGNNVEPNRPLTELDKPTPRTAYGRTKLWSEAALRLECGASVRTSILRPGPYYGPGQSASFKLLSRLVTSGIAPNVGGSLARQSLAHIDNVVDALIAASLQPQDGHRTMLVADATPYSMAELLAAVAKAHKLPLRTLPIPMSLSRASERLACTADRSLGLHVGLLTMAGEFGRNRWCSIDHASKQIGYSPTRFLEDGILEAWLETQPSAA